MVSEELAHDGYEASWHRGEPGTHTGWGSDFVRGTRNSETVMFESANSKVPWVATRRMEVTDDTKHQAVKIAQLIL